MRKKTKKVVTDPLDRKIRRLEERLKEARHAYLRRHRWSLIMLGGTTLWYRLDSGLGSIAVPTETAIGLQRAWSFGSLKKGLR